MFLTTYATYCGTSEIPPEFNRWCGLLALAAAAENRVYVEKLGEKIVPNLYVFLLGPSGVGKGASISHLMRLLRLLPIIRTYRGKLTYAALIDLLNEKRSQAPPRLLLVTPELGMSVGRGPLADELVKLLTELYTGGDYEFTEQTRTHGPARFTNHSICWIAGTTREWLRDCISRDAVEGGFFARVACISAAYDFDHRIYIPTHDNTLLPILAGHLAVVTALAGPMILTEQADAVLRIWYEQRPTPDDHALIPAWKRGHDLVLKLAMLQALADDPPSRTITVQHVVAAQQLAEETMASLPHLVEFVSLTPDTEGGKRVEDAISRAKVIQHRSLVRAMLRYGIMAPKVREYVDTLVQGGLVEIASLGAGAKVTYVWRGRPVRIVDGGEDANDATQQS